MTNRQLYETTADYKKSIQILKNFINEVLDADIDKLNTLCFDDLDKYVGSSIDPDMFLITQAIYILLWGDIYQLSFDDMGSWNAENINGYRGDTMNSFGSLIGKEDKRKGHEFAYRAKYFGAEKNERIWAKIEKFSRVYHMLGNFIVIPNRGTIQYGINGARATYYNKDYCEGMRDYFDWFLIALMIYQKKVMRGETEFVGFERQLNMNIEYHPKFMSVSEWEERFFLEPYFKFGTPTLLFKTPLEERLKITTPSEERKNNDYYYSDEEYLELLEDYLDKSMITIFYRTGKMVARLKEILANE